MRHNTKSPDTRQEPAKSMKNGDYHDGARRRGHDFSHLMEWLSPADLHELAHNAGITTTQVYNRIRGRTGTNYIFIAEVLAVAKRNIDLLNECEKVKKIQPKLA
jgi:hypothetical protein